MRTRGGTAVQNAYGGARAGANAQHPGPSSPIPGGSEGALDMDLGDRKYEA